MKQETRSSSFDSGVPRVENIYELVVVAAQRARQLNEFQMHMPPESQINPVDKAMAEAFNADIAYEVLDRNELAEQLEKEAEEEE
jgi:DNA-directed RNA polymerase omega subunit